MRQLIGRLGQEGYVDGVDDNEASGSVMARAWLESLSPAEEGWLPSGYLVLFNQILSDFCLSYYNVRSISYHSKSIFRNRDEILREQIQPKLQLTASSTACISFLLIQSLISTELPNKRQSNQAKSAMAK